MSPTDAQKRATQKWQKDKVDDVRFRVPKGKRAEMQAHATARGESLNGFLNRVVNEAMEREKDTHGK